MIKKEIEIQMEIRDINRFPSEKQLAIYCGIACVNNVSGKVTKAKAVYNANKICKQTLITINRDRPYFY